MISICEDRVCGDVAAPESHFLATLEDKLVALGSDKTKLARRFVIQEAQIHRALVMQQRPGIPLRRIGRTVTLSQRFQKHPPLGQGDSHRDGVRSFRQILSDEHRADLILVTSLEVDVRTSLVELDDYGASLRDFPTPARVAGKQSRSRNTCAQ
jgi:hypothetical protein